MNCPLRRQDGPITEEALNASDTFARHAAFGVFETDLLSKLLIAMDLDKPTHPRPRASSTNDAKMVNSIEHMESFI